MKIAVWMGQEMRTSITLYMPSANVSIREQWEHIAKPKKVCGAEFQVHRIAYAILPAYAQAETSSGIPTKQYTSSSPSWQYDNIIRHSTGFFQAEALSLQ